MSGTIDGTGGTSKEATDILSDKIDKQTSTMKSQIANMDPSATMDAQLKMTRGMQNLSLYYTMEINIMNLVSSLEMKAINAIRVPQ